MARSFSTLRLAFAGLGSLAVLAGCGGGGSGGGVDRPSGALIVGGTPTVQALNTPLGTAGSRGSGALVYVSFNLRDKEFNPTNVQLEYGYDVNGDGNITGSAEDPAPDDEYFPCTPAPGLGDGNVGLDSATGKGANHLFVWNSAADVPTRRFVTQDYQYTAQGRQVLGSDGLPLFGSTPGIRLRMRANDLNGDPKRWGDWKVTTAFDLNNNQQPAVTIDPVGLNGVTPNATGSAADEGVVLNINLIDGDSGLGFPDAAAVAVDYAFVPPGTNLSVPAQVAALAWTPATTYPGTADTGLATSAAPGTPHTFTWDSAADAGTLNGDFVLRVTPFDSKSETGPTVMQTGSFKLDNYTIFTDAGAGLSAARVGHRATTLADNRVLITGGSQTVGGAAINTAELFYPGVGQTTFGAIAPTGSMNTARAFHSQTRLNDDRVLVAGGVSAAGTPLTSLEIYDPALGTWTTLGATLGTARSRHTAVLLSDGDVLFAGGVDGSGNPLASGEVFHFENGTVVAVSNAMTSARHSVDGALLPNRKAIIPGGTGAGNAPLASVEMYNQATNTFSAGVSMSSARSQHSVSCTVDGRVFAVGGVGLNSVEVFDPRAGGGTGAWSTAPGTLTTARSGHVGVLLGSGRILAAGGFDGTAVVATADEFLTATGTMNAPNGSEITGRRDAAAALLNNGRVLVVGGQDAAGAALASVEVYSPDAGFNYGPTAYITTPQEEQSWGFGAVFNYRLVDPEQDHAKVIFQYSIAGAPWLTCTSQGGPYLDATNDPDTIAGDINEGLVDLITTAANSSLPIDPILKNTVGDHLFIWDMTADIAKADYPTVKVRCLPYGAGNGVGASTTSFKVAKNTRVIPFFEGFAGPVHGSVDVWYHLRDIDGADPVYGDSARVEFQYGIDLNGDKQILADDGESFKTCTEVTSPAGSEGLGPNWTLSTSKTYSVRGPGVPGWHLFRWDSVRDAGSPDIGAINSSVILRITPYDNPDFFAGNPASPESKGRVTQLTSAPANGIRLDLDTTNGLFLTRVENETNTKFYQSFPSVSGSMPFSNILLDETIVFTFTHPVDPASVDGAVGLDTLKVMYGANQVLGSYRSDTATNKVYFYPLLQEIKDNVPKYTGASNETPTVLFRGRLFSVEIPGFVAGTNPETATILRKNGWASGTAAVEIANLLARNYASAFTTTAAAGASAFVARATGPVFVSSTPTHTSTDIGTGTTTITVNLQNQISGESVTANTLRFRVDLDGDGVTDINDPVLYGKYQVTNTAGTIGGTAASVITFVLDGAYTLPPGCRILVDFSGVTSGNGPTASGGASGTAYFGTVAGSSTTVVFTEPFSTSASAYRDPASTALWGDSAFPGILTGNRDGGTGTDGTPTPQSSSTVNGVTTRTFSATKTNNTWNFTSFTIPKNEVWLFTGASAGPVTILCTTNIDIAGVLDVSGRDGQGKNTEVISSYTSTSSPYGGRFASYIGTGSTILPGGVAYAGGGKGGDSLAMTNGQAGTAGSGGSASNAGGGGSQYSSTYQTGGGGAGHAQSGQTGGTYQSGYGSAGAGGSSYGTSTFSSGMTAGSGGGAGSSYYTYYYSYDQLAHGSSSYGYYYYYWPGGSGGGGGGAVKFSCNGSFTIRGSGIIDASGGCGGNGYYYYAGGGGGGSGGSVWIRSGGNFTPGGLIDVRGGFGGVIYNYHPYSFGSPTRYGPAGGHGSAGRVRIEAPNFDPASLPVTTNFVAGTSFATTTSGSLNGGTGANGAFPGSSTATVNIDSISKDAGGYMNFTTMNIPSGVTVTLSGSTAAKIRVSGAVTISGVLSAPGGNGYGGAYGSSSASVISGGTAGVGGGTGGIPNGSGVTTFTRGGNGSGSGGGGGGYPANLWNGSYYYGSSSGGGGANMLNFSGAPMGSIAGGIPNIQNNTNMTGSVHDYYNSGYGATRLFGPAGVGFNDPEALSMTNLVGGSGGGAGANSGYSIYFYGASSGGGGAGAIGIETASTFTMGASARVDLIGGNGGNYPYNYQSGCGAGGAGGTFLVRASSLAISTGATINTIGGVGGNAYSSPTSYHMGCGGVGGLGIARLEAVTLPNISNTGGILGYSTSTGSLTTAYLKGGGGDAATLWQTAAGTVSDFNTQNVDKSTSPSGDVSVFLEGAPIDPVTGVRSTNIATYVRQKIAGSSSTALTSGTVPPDAADGFKFWRMIFQLNPPSASFPGFPELTNVSMNVTTK